MRATRRTGDFDIPVPRPKNAVDPKDEIILNSQTQAKKMRKLRKCEEDIDPED